MPKPLSLDIRRRFQRCIEGGMSGREAARRLLVSAATASRLSRKIAGGRSLAPAPCGPKPGKGKLAPHHSFLIELIDQDPDITLHELRGSLEAAHGLRVHHSATGYALDRLGHTFKKRASSRMNAGRLASGKQGRIG